MCIMINKLITNRLSSTLMLLFVFIVMHAQSTADKNVSKSIFSLTTFKADGSLLSTSHGVFVDSNGNAISAWKPFVGASKAVVIDAQGKKYDVEGIIDADDIYNVCKFHVNAKNTSAANVIKKSVDATKPVISQGAQLWLASYDLKNPKFINASVSKTEVFKDNYTFYIVDIKAPSDVDYCPLINNEGQVVALLQSVGDKVHAVDASLPANYSVTAFAQTSTSMAKSMIPVIIPDEQKEAQLALVLAGQTRKDDSYKATIEAFIKKFPTLSDGYEARAIYETSNSDFASASSDMEKAIEVSSEKADSHYKYSDLIMQKTLYMSDAVYEPWSLDKALEEARSAVACSDLPIYRQQEAKVLTLMSRYQEAFDIYMSLENTQLAGPENLFSALKCKQLMEAPFEDQIVLMDSIIAACPHPLTYQSGPYILNRALMYHEHGDYRKALQEYMDYEKLMVGHQLSDNFYYTRFTCERDGKIYQPALDDIDRAIAINPVQPMYYCEKGALLVRLSKPEEAIACANKCLQIDPKNADAYAILGTAQCISGKNYEGILNLEEAKSLGHMNADTLIKKYKK